MLFRCVAAIPNGGGGCVEHFYEDTAAGRASAEAFARQHDKPARAKAIGGSPWRRSAAGALCRAHAPRRDHQFEGGRRPV
jgi:hypothetical protein